MSEWDCEHGRSFDLCPICTRGVGGDRTAEPEEVAPRSDRYNCLAQDFAFDQTTEPGFPTDKLAALLRQVDADEREACARVCDDWKNQTRREVGYTNQQVTAAATCAAAIRARADSPSQ